MKDLKVYDGAGWQSLKGPPGPSTPSADAGNIITKGSDGLLYSGPSADDGNRITLGSDGLPMVRGDLVASGVWTPKINGFVVGVGCWSRSGPVVTVIIEWDNSNDIEDGALVEGLPFSLALGDDQSYYPSYAAVSTFGGIILGAGDLFLTGDPTVLVLQLVSPAFNYIPLGNTSTLTYRTQDAFLV